jgi:hypothetical protein
MNKTEARFAEMLEGKLRRNEIAWYGFEAVRLKLATKTYYTPDFVILHNDGTLEFAEVKGHWEDDARVKIKVVAKMFWMFTFRAYKPVAQKHGGGWETEEFGK